MSENLTDQTVVQFLDALASSAPAPGGGSAAALSGALGAALVSMVCNLTLGKAKYADVQDEISALVEQSEALRHLLIDLLEADVKVYSGVSRAYKMPRKTREEKAARTATIQAPASCHSLTSSALGNLPSSLSLLTKTGLKIPILT